MQVKCLARWANEREGGSWGREEQRAGGETFLQGWTLARMESIGTEKRMRWVWEAAGQRNSPYEVIHTWKVIETSATERFHSVTRLEFSERLIDLSRHNFNSVSWQQSINQSQEILSFSAQINISAFQFTYSSLTTSIHKSPSLRHKSLLDAESGFWSMKKVAMPCVVDTGLIPGGLVPENNQPFPDDNWPHSAMTGNLNSRFFQRQGGHIHLFCPRCNSHIRATAPGGTGQISPRLGKHSINVYC